MVGFAARSRRAPISSTAENGGNIRKGTASLSVVS